MKKLSSIGAVSLLTIGVAVPCASAAVSTIAQVTAAGAGTYEIQGTVAAVLNVASTTESFVITDATGGIIAYNIAKTTYTPTAGDSIDFTATNAPYQGGAELTTTNFALDAAVVPGTAPAPITIDVSELTAGATSGGFPLSEELVTLDGVSFGATTTTLANNTTYTITDASGSGSVYPYKSDSVVLAAEQAANAAGILPGPVDITGYVDVYNPSGTSPTYEIYPTSITASAVAPEPASLGVLSLGAVALLKRRRR
jgi:hypothetical protein